MKARVDPQLCIGCALCAATCPEVFRMEGDKAVAYVEVVPTGLEENCKKAVDECPVVAIFIEE